jgi:hypothetical protein
MVYDVKKKVTRQCKNSMKIGSFCKSHAKKIEDLQDDPETDVERDSSLSQPVAVEDDITTSMKELTLSNDKGVVVECEPIPQDWTPNRVQSFGGILDPVRKRWQEYIPEDISKSVYQDVLQYFSQSPSPDRPGQVYITRSYPTWRVLEKGEIIIKIGRADNAEERKKKLARWCQYYTFELLFAFPDTERKIRLSRKAERLAHKSLGNRLYQPTSSGKCMCQKPHQELFKIPESELKKTITMVQYWANVVEKYEEIWPGISFKGRTSI